MNLSSAQRLRQDNQVVKHAIKQSNFALRVAIPGIIQSFDPNMQTAEVQLALNELVTSNGAQESATFPLLPDVPIVIPRAGGYSLTLPIKQGDECLVIFADMCIDAWWQSGGVQEQLAQRRHSLSDGFAILGPWSQPRVLPNYSTASAQLRNDAGNVVVDVAGSAVTVTAPTVTVNAQNANVTASQQAQVTGQTVKVAGTQSVTITGAGQTMIEGVSFLEHTHSAVSAGTGVSGPVVP